LCSKNIVSPSAVAGRRCFRITHLNIEDISWLDVLQFLLGEVSKVIASKYPSLASFWGGDGEFPSFGGLHLVSWR
jgi:hypothetical protein